MFLDDRIAQRELAMDPVQVAPSLTTPLDIPGVLQVAQDAVCVTLGDVCGRRNFPDANVGHLSNGEQDLGVIGDESPPPGRRIA